AVTYRTRSRLPRRRAERPPIPRLISRRAPAPACDWSCPSRRGGRLLRWRRSRRAWLVLLPPFPPGPPHPAGGGAPGPPLGWWVKGPADLAAAAVRGAAIVGSRAATAYGEHVTTELSYGLAARGFDIVSGGAYGIDAAAHRAALSAEGQTILVSAAGLD